MSRLQVLVLPVLVLVSAECARVCILLDLEQKHLRTNCKPAQALACRRSTYALAAPACPAVGPAAAAAASYSRRYSYLISLVV